MNRSDLAERLASCTGMSMASAKDVVDGVFETVGEALENGKEARNLGFGTFGTRRRPARTACNRPMGKKCVGRSVDGSGLEAGQDTLGYRGQQPVMNGARIQRERHAGPAGV